MRAAPPNIVREVLAELRHGVTPRECAMRYSLAETTVRSYRMGRRGMCKPLGRPRALTTEQEHVLRRPQQDPCASQMLRALGVEALMRGRRARPACTSSRPSTA